MHKSRLGNIVIDCQTEDLLHEAQFWSAALGYPLPEDPDAASGFIQLQTPPGEVQVILQRVRHPARAHLDLETDSVESEIARLEQLGAKVVSRKEQWVVMQAPSGHRFCVGSPYRGGFDHGANEWPWAGVTHRATRASTKAAQHATPARRRPRRRQRPGPAR